MEELFIYFLSVQKKVEPRDVHDVPRAAPPLAMVCPG